MAELDRNLAMELVRVTESAALAAARWMGRNEKEKADAAAVDAICSGLLVRCAGRLAEDVALAADAGLRESRLALVLRAADDARSGSTPPEAVERELLTHGLDWTRIECELLQLPDAGTAREAAMCIRVDGQTIAEVAEAAGVPVVRLSTLIEDADASFAPYLGGAGSGELIGPVEHAGGHTLILVGIRTPPAASDPELRRRAAALLEQRAAQRAVRTFVEWHDASLR